MSEEIPLDTDVLLKLATFELLDALIAKLKRLGAPGALGLSHLIAPSQLARLKFVANRAAAEQRLRAGLASLVKIEPTAAEIDLAASIEEIALRLNLPLDRGEAQLVAVTLLRDLKLLVTGDKRAICCFENVLRVLGRAGSLADRVACIEQALWGLISASNHVEVRAKLCSEAFVDKAISIVFACGRAAPDESSVLAGLRSYIEDLRRSAQGVLCQGID